MADAEFLAASSKSCRFMMLLRGGFSADDRGAALGVSFGSGSAQALVIVLSSRVPFKAFAGRPFWMMDAAWMSL